MADAALAAVAAADHAKFPLKETTKGCLILLGHKQVQTTLYFLAKVEKELELGNQLVSLALKHGMNVFSHCRSLFVSFGHKPHPARKQI